MTPKPIVHVYLRRSFHFALIAAVMLAQSACLGGSTEAVPVTGVYELRTVNNQALPFSFSNGQTVVKQVLTIKPDGSFTDVTSRLDGSVVSDTGAYTNFGGTVTFIDQSVGFVYQGMVTGSELVTQIGSFRSVYARTGAVPIN